MVNCRNYAAAGNSGNFRMVKTVQADDVTEKKPQFVRAERCVCRAAELKNRFFAFKKSTLRETIKEAVPLSRIVLETDSPYMAPVPNRGKRNESAYVKNVAEMLADVFGLDLHTIVLHTTENALKVFPKAVFFMKK